MNATPLGRSGFNDLSIDLSQLPVPSLVYDINYSNSLLLRTAEARGNRILNGLNMLLHQAAKSFEIWFSIKPNIKLIKL